MKKIIIGVIFLIILMSFVIISRAESEKVDKYVYSELGIHEEVKVLIKAEEDSGFIFKTDNVREIREALDKKPVLENGDLITAEISKQELKKLQNSNAVQGIELSPQFTAFLQNSSLIVNASRTWSLQSNGINITGINQTVCVIDTGINFDHSDLIGRNKTCVIDCFNKNCTENCSIGDDNGHGTHVAGIVAASGGINGIAKGASLIGLKVLDSNGESSAQGTTDINNAIEWCVSNKNAYNISVISMSLGTPNLYTDYCDSSFTLSGMTQAINNATVNNISVVAASGNAATGIPRNTTAISSPACLSNSTAVSATDKDDSIASYSHYNSFVKLFAPGTDINSTCINGGYCSKQGTSMATPHVAGAIAIIKEFLQLTNQVKTPKEIEAILNNTGKRINDANGLNFSRINVYDAIISLDTSAPNVNLISPLNNQINMSRNQTFSCNASDLSLKNVTFYLWNSSSSIVNTSSTSISGASYTYSVNVSDLSFGSYKWNCLFYDEKGNFNFSAYNFTLTIGSIVTSLISPQNNNHTKLNYTDFSCGAETEAEYSLKNISFYLWNSTSLIYNETKNISGTLNTTGFNYTFVSESRYLWSCLSVNNNSNLSLADNFSITYDVTKPNVSLVEPFPSDETSSSAVKIFYYNASDNFDISKCELIVNNAIAASNSSGILNINNITYTLTPGTYSWQINCTDLAGNQDNSSSRNIIITAPVVRISSSGGGGGAIVQIYTLTKEQASLGYTKELGKSEKIIFTIFDEKAEQHELTLDYVGSNFVNLTLRSAPIKIVLGIGQSIKLNLTSPNYYDLYIKLEGIANNKAKLTIQTIHEIISAETSTGKSEEKEGVSETPPSVDYGGFKKMWQTYAGLYIAVILGVIILGYILLKSFKKSIKLKVELKLSHTKQKR